MRRFRLRSLAALALALGASPALADDDAPATPGKAKPASAYYELDTKNLFGFLEGADVGDKGGSSVEFETTGAFGLRRGRYASIEQEIIYETTPTDRLGLEFGAHFLGQEVAGIDLAPNYRGVNFSGLSWEGRFVAMARGEASPFQLTLTATPEWSRIDNFGQRAQAAAVTFRAIADAVFLEDRLYVAGNLVYTPQRTWMPGQSPSDGSNLGASAAASYRLTPDWMVGAQADLELAYDGLAARSFLGRALYVGPIFHYQINKTIDLSGAVLRQVAGQANGDPRSLDLVDFSRTVAKLRLEVDF